MEPLKKRLIISNLFIFSGLFVLISFNKEYLRPAFIHIPILNLLTGVFPNFIAAFLISFGVVNAAVTRKFKRARLIVYLTAFFVFLILAFEEILPLWGASKVGDIRDIFASLIGSLLAIFTFEIIHSKQKKKKNSDIENLTKNTENK
ncbi:MAG: hypothetical protein JXL97_02910 [Bacteroidales bacterium]|nr:hypothetical protein [Bacteroidales bacterium]